MTRFGCLVVLLVAALACARQEPPRGGLGRRVAEGEAAALRASPDGEYLAFLAACRALEDRMLPRGTAACELSVVPTRGGPAVRVASGVSTLGAGFGWSRRGHLVAALGRYDHVTGRGELFAWSGGDARRLGGDVAFFAVSPGGERVGWISGGRLFVAGEPAWAPTVVRGADDVATFAFAGDAGGPLELLARRSARAGGTLLAVRGGAAVPVADEVREYGFSGSGRRFAFTAGRAQALMVRPASTVEGATASRVELGREVREFLFSPHGEEIAFVADAVPGTQGDLWSAPLAGGPPVRLGRRVGEPRWTRDGGRLAWLADYDPRSRTGSLTVGGRGLAPRSVARNVSDFDLTADGAAVTYLVHDTAGGYSVDLGLAAPGGGGAPQRVARGVFGFAFSPDDAWLYWRSACVREAEACDLLRAPVRSATPATPERVAEGVKSFEFAPGRPGRLLVTWARRDRVALDLAVWEGGKLTAVDTVALTGSAQFAGPDPGRIAYVVVDPKRAGVYVAEVP